LTPRHATKLAVQNGSNGRPALKTISELELLLRATAKFAAVSGVVALLVWVTWVMLDLKNLQSGFTLPS
jgi:hypothetical protein